MEVDRINQVQGLKKVERTGSESERRRHQRPDEEFTELLEQSMKDADSDEQHGGSGNGSGTDHHTDAAQPPVAQPLPHDIVSLSTDPPVRSMITTDKVSISTAALVGSESLKAQNGALRLSLVQRTVQGLRDLALTQHGSAPVDKAPLPPPLSAAAPPPPPAPSSVDTLA
jgi:hypothetical protein